MPNVSPAILLNVSFSLSSHAAMMVMKMGVPSDNKELWMAVVNDNHLMNNNWLMATPVNAHNKKRGRCFLSNPALLGFIKKSNQNNNKLDSTRTTFKAKGAMNSGVMVFTTA
jgi:hypothetical protein